MLPPVLSVPLKILRSAVAGRRPGDGNFRALTDGELFVNQLDHVLCILDGKGNLLTFSLDPSAIMAPTNLIAALKASYTTLPTSDPNVAGAPFLNGGALFFSTGP